jgi:hypothetical protein
MTSQAQRPADGNWIQLQPEQPAQEEQAKALLAQLSFLAIFCTVMFLLGLFSPPWLWPSWGKMAALIGACLCGWIGISCLVKLGHRRFANWRLSGVLGPYEVWTKDSPPMDQTVTVRIQQRARRPILIERLDVSLISLQTIVQVAFDPATPHLHPALVRDRELWSDTKTTSFERAFFPADSTIEVTIEFKIPEVGQLRGPLGIEELKKPGVGHTERIKHHHWRVRIETHLADGRTTKDLFCLPTEFGESTVPE